MRPMRPKPLIPTRTAIPISFSSVGLPVYLSISIPTGIEEPAQSQTAIPIACPQATIGEPRGASLLGGVRNLTRGPRPVGTIISIRRLGSRPAPVLHFTGAQAAGSRAEGRFLRERGG